MKQVRERSNMNNILLWVMNILLILLLIYEVACMIYSGVVNVAIGETRMSTKVIDDLVHGINPYGKEWLSDSNSLPPIYYESGFFHLLPSVLIAKFFPCNTFAAATITHCSYVILALAMMYFCVYSITKEISLGLIASNIFFFCLNVSVVTNVRPDTLCSLCIITIILLIYWDSDYYSSVYSLSDKKAKPKLSVCAEIREWLVAILGVLLLFLKIHYASILFALFFVYLRRKRIFPMIIKGAIIGIITLFVTQICFPTFYSTFIVRVIEMLRDNTEIKTITSMWMKWGSLIRLFPVVFFLLLVSFLFIKDLKIIYKNDFILLLIINIVFNILALCFMGKWPGNGIIYHKTMLMASAIVAAMMVVKNLENKYIKLNWILEYGIAIISIICIYACQNDIKFDFQSLPKRIDSRKVEFAELDEYKSDNMLLAPEKSFYAFANGIYQWDYGDQIYLPYDIGTSPRWNFLFPYTNEYRRKNTEYAMHMIEMIENKEYSIIITDEYNVLGRKIGLEEQFQEAIESNYEVLKTSGVMTYWLPLEE